MRLALAVALVVLAVPFSPALGQLPLEPTAGERVFVLVMSGNNFNEKTWPDTPLLEAYLGEPMTFVVHVPLNAEPHVFHLHGHPWFDEEEGRFIDAKLLMPGETTVFNANAGGEERNAGDWLYHCHMDDHFERGMFGVLRVYPYAMQVAAVGPALDVRLERLGEPLEGAALTLTVAGATVPASVVDRGDGGYTMLPRGVLPAGAKLVLTADHPAHGETVWRGTWDGPGPVRTVSTPTLPTPS